MPISLRKRGQVYHARGSVRVGSTLVRIPEYSTGCRSRADAEAQASAEEARIRKDTIDGGAGLKSRLTIADCILAYMDRPGGLKSYGLAQLDDFNSRIGNRTLLEADDAWQVWLKDRGAALSPGSVARWRSTLNAALVHGAKANSTVAPPLPGVRVPVRAGVPYLPTDEANLLLASYSPAARPVAITLAYQGLRTQEALRLEWRDVSWKRRTLFVGRGKGAVAQTKSGKSRTVPMHRRVRVALYLIWRAMRRPKNGPVFLSSRGAPYEDTTGKGGNPLKKQHATACRSAGVTDFRIHDWRHHWAAHMVMTGTDLYTLMRLGGWSSLRMVERYAAVSVEHMAAAVARLK